MGPSQSQLKLLSREDRILYWRWMRRGLLFYSSIMALLVVAAFANNVFRSQPGDLAGDMHTAAISTRK
jgi:hypothetical protein